MLQNTCKVIGYKKNMVYKILLEEGVGGWGVGVEVNHSWPAAYIVHILSPETDNCPS